MVGLVVVSHSAKLAEGVAELMRGMAGAEVQIAMAGGMDLPDHPPGTDANLIYRAIQQVYSTDGVVVLVDLGSAILSAELALEMLPPAQRTRVVIAPAPLVEGSIAAAVQARLDSPLEAVVAEARAALDAKLAHFQEDVSGKGRVQAGEKDAWTREGDVSPNRLDRVQEVILRVENRLGLHMRPAAKFVQTAAGFESDVRLSDLTNGRGPVNAKSFNGVTTLGALRGHQIKITAGGADAQAALDALEHLARENFGDPETLTVEPPPTPSAAAEPRAENEIVGLAASPEYAIGPARLYRPTLAAIPRNTIQDPEREWARLSRALEQTERHLHAARAALNGRGNAAEAGIFDAEVLMLRDEALQEPARRAIFEKKWNAALAFDRAAALIASQYDALEDEYLRARAADLRAVARLVLLNVLGASEIDFSLAGVLVASDLTPAETAQLDPKMNLAICTASGGPTGHTAILAKSLGIPAVVGLGEKILAVREGETLLVDGERGRVWVNPAPELVSEYKGRMERAQNAAEAARRARDERAVTRDGHRVEIAANIGSVREAEQAVEMGAEAVGLFRTEFLFLDRRDAPGEEEQYAAYRAVAQALRNRSLLIRTLDLGGDKPVSYANVPREANPFLGLRGLRLSLAQPEFFRTQLRAILRLANEFPVRVMYPMVSTLREFRDAQTLMEQARAELQTRGIAVPARVETGIMVEVPSAALAAAQFAAVVDFFSIGTNDLTQYTFAAERGNPQVASLADSLHPAVLQLIANVIAAAHARDKWVGVCGEMAGDPEAIPLLVGLGVDELSMSPAIIPTAKQIVRDLRLSEAKALAQRALSPDADSIRDS